MSKLGEHAELVENILSSFEFHSRQTLDTLWAQEVEDRIDAYEQGKITAISAEEVFDRIQMLQN